MLQNKSLKISSFVPSYFHFLGSRPFCILSGNVFRFLLPLKALMHKHVVMLGTQRKEKKGPKTFCFGNGNFCFGNGTAATAPNIQTCCSILISALFQLLFWNYTWACLVPSVRSFTVQNSCAWPRVIESLCGLGKCQGSAPRGVRGLGWPQSLGESSTWIMESQGWLKFGGDLPAAASLTRGEAKVGKTIPTVTHK